MSRCWVGILGLIGCGRIGFAGLSDVRGDGGALDPDAVIATGTRLQARYWTAADGARVFSSFFDPMIGSRCTFEADSTGTLHCFPSEALPAFADAGCTAPALRVATGCASTPTLGTVRIQDSATAFHYQAVAFGAPTSGFISLGSCNPAVDGAAYYAVGGAQPDAMFVGGTASAIELADGLARQELVADDGSRQILGYTFQGRPCSVRRIDATSAACFPYEVYAFSSPITYSDAACTIQIAVVNGSPVPAYIEALQSDAPCAGSRYVAVGGQQTLTTVYARDSGGACTPIAQASTLYTTLTDATSMLPVLTRVIDAGTTRLRTSAWLSAGGARIEAGLYDTVLTAPCTPSTDTAGNTTCAPLGFPKDISYTNASCNMQPPQAEAVCDGDDTTLSSSVTELQKFATCDGLGVPLTTYTTRSAATLAFDKYAGTCVPMDVSAATMFTPTTAPYQPSRAVALSLQ